MWLYSFMSVFDIGMKDVRVQQHKIRTKFQFDKFDKGIIITKKNYEKLREPDWKVIDIQERDIKKDF